MKLIVSSCGRPEERGITIIEGGEVTHAVKYEEELTGMDFWSTQGLVMPWVLVCAGDGFYLISTDNGKKVGEFKTLSKEIEKQNHDIVVEYNHIFVCDTIQNKMNIYLKSNGCHGGSREALKGDREKDSLHINSFCSSGREEPQYFLAWHTSNKSKQWKHEQDQGFVGDFLNLGVQWIQGLQYPHSLKFIDSNFMLLESLPRTLNIYDHEFRLEAKHPLDFSFPRGLAKIPGGWAVGSSGNREWGEGDQGAVYMLNEEFNVQTKIDIPFREVYEVLCL